jgi:choline dehydrogenase-like flavoprotein
MIVDGRSVPTGTALEFDVCIIGGGIAGIAMALQFIDDPGVAVALVESGGREWDARTQELSEAASYGQPYFPVKETHIRVLGGSSLSYGGVCSELSPLQFEERPWVPDSGWPFGKDELEPYVARACRLFEIDRSDPTPAAADDGRTEWRRIWFSPPTRFGRRYAPDLERAGNVTTCLHSTVTRLQAHPGGGHIEGADLTTTAGNHFRIIARHYVLAGGGIENPRLLLASNDVLSAGIGNAHDNVGRYFQEHPRMTDRYRLAVGTDALARHITGAAGTLSFSRLGLSEQTQRDEELLDFYANLSFGYSGQNTPQWPALRRIINSRRSPWSDSPYYQDIGGGPNRVRWEDVRAALARPDRTARSLLGAALRPGFLRRWVELQSSVEQVPRRENRVVLSSTRDELGMPRAELHWTLDEREERTYRRGRELLLAELDRLEPGLSARRMDDPDQWPDHVIGTWHHIGTTRMHRDPRKGVVDADARVHGVDNLFLAGCSVFPNSGATGPSLTIASLSLRLKDHLISQLRAVATG